MPDKKRKAETVPKASASKRQSIEGRNGIITVNHINSNAPVKPVIASSPGVTLPPNLRFKGYANGSELLLHSSDHPTIDFTARDEYKGTGGTHLKHYVAIFDPTKSSLSVVEAKKVTVRGQVRPRPKDVDDQDPADEAAAANATYNYSSRTALTETFGTKKSKKAVQSIAENRLLTGGDEGEDGSNNPLSNALMATMPKDEDLPNGIPADIVQENKPLPRPNLEATMPNTVYPLSSLIFPPDALALLDVSDWKDIISSKGDVQTISRFVSSRVELYTQKTLDPDDTNATEYKTAMQRLLLLRYLLILIELSSKMSSKPGSHSGRKVPPTPKLHQQLSNPKPPVKIIDGIRCRFVASDGTMRSFETQLLHTTICAITLHLPSRKTLNNPNVSFATEPSEIRDDIAIDDKTVRQYFRELGCRLDVLTDADAAAFGIRKKKKKDAAAEADGDALQAKVRDVRIAKLRLPLHFPKRGGGNPNRSR